MEIKTTQVTCPNGHHYDSAQHSACPVCGAPAGNFIPTRDPGSLPVGFPHTEPIDGGGSFSPTEPIYGGGGGVTLSNSTYRNRPTEPVVGGVGPQNFLRPTVIGGDAAPGGQTEPVVGWLVCIGGPVRGVDFRIHAGYNYIGRDSGDIHIKGDQQISRENHAMIAFDNSDNTFFVGPAAGRNLIKVNGKTVINAIEIHRGDVISIGTTKLIFIPLCGEDFSWGQGRKDSCS